MKNVVLELYHWGRCVYLSGYGVPLDAFDFVYRVTACEVFVLADIVVSKYRWKMVERDLLKPSERLREWHNLSPGQQYRLHMQQGGYRP